jgi:heme exporter protein C
MREKVLYALGIAGVALLARNLYVLARMPQETSLGAVSKLVFFEAPMAVTAMIAMAVAVIASLCFLVTRHFKFDAMAVAVTETSLAFLAATLVTGSFAARAASGIWWTWDWGLTSALVCWLLYAAYLMLRRSVEEPSQRATFAAVWSIFAFIDVPIVIFSVQWWRSQHHQPMFWSGRNFPPGWYALLGWNLTALIIVAAALTLIRVSQEDVRRELDAIRRMAHAF